MHKIGENILYGSNGVMTVVDIREEYVGDQPRSYYVMRAATGRSESLVFVPTDNDRLIGTMYSLLSREELEGILNSPVDSARIEWNESSRARTEYFKRIMESGDRSMIISMIRAIYECGIRRTEIGKKNFLADETVKQKAEKLLATEISIVFGISEDEAIGKIRSKIEN